MTDFNRRLPHISVDRFSLIPAAEIPRSTFITTHSHKTTFDAGYLIPIHVDEVLPGDSILGKVSIFARLSTPLFPVMDNLKLTTFFFYVPIRIVWTSFVNMMGERADPANSISFTVPQIVSPSSGFAVGSIYDYFGLPVVGQTAAANTISINALPLRCYNKIYNDWFRDENLQNTSTSPVSMGDGPDTASTYVLLRRNKAHDYFTSALPWPLKGGVDVSFLTGLANVKGLSITTGNTPTSGSPASNQETGGTAVSGWTGYYTSPSTPIQLRATGTTLGSQFQLQADLSTAQGATINALRTAFQTQRLLERDARGGTRYTEQLRAHWGVISPDFRLQRPEYIGGGVTPIQTSAIPQTSATGLTGGSSPLGALGAAATASDQHSFSYHATEHGYIIGLAHVTSDLTYQQGIRKLWSRLTRYDFYLPVFAFLGEQAILNKEIYSDGQAGDGQIFGYQERWAEYKHFPSLITGLFRSTSAGTIDPWHTAIKFTATPVLNTSFIQDAPPLSRVLAAGAAANGMQILFDSVFEMKRTRAMPMFSVPGNLDRF